MRLPVTVPLLLLAMACAPSSRALVRIQPRSADGAGGGTAGAVQGSDGRRILHGAPAVLRERGLEIASCGEERIVTAPRELDVPCGPGTCLARELFVVSAGERGASVEILRGVWEPSARYWVMALAPSTARDAVAQEAELLRAILDAATVPASATDGCRPQAAALLQR